MIIRLPKRNQTKLNFNTSVTIRVELKTPEMWGVGVLTRDSLRYLTTVALSRTCRTERNVRRLDAEPALKR
jgi:hypothetical protein